MLLFQAVAFFNTAIVVSMSKSLQHRNVQATVCRSSNSDESIPRPHTALAQVLANQYSIDISSVEAKGKKIMASDVEFHAYKVSQPPCTPHALKLAYSYGLDLNVLYDDHIDDELNDGQAHFLKMSDVELLKENLRSLRVSTQKFQGNAGGAPIDGRRKQQHLDELEKRMEKNVGQLSEKALQVAGSVASVIQTIQSQVKLPISGDIFGPGDKVDSVQDFDQELANEIQAALMSAGVDDKETMNLMRILEMPLNGSENGEKINGVDKFNKEKAAEMEKTTSKAFYFADPL